MTVDEGIRQSYPLRPFVVFVVYAPFKASRQSLLRAADRLFESAEPIGLNWNPARLPK